MFWVVKEDPSQEEAKLAFAQLKPLLGCEFMESSTNRGAVITHCREGLPAAVSGLEENDLVLGVAHTPVKDKMDFSHAISGYNPGMHLSWLTSNFWCILER